MNKFRLEYYPHLSPNNLNHKHKRKLIKGSCFADKALVNLFVPNVLGN